MIESWMITAGMSIGAIVAMFAVTKYVVAESARRIDGIGKKVDEHSEVISQHKVMASTAITMEQVDRRFVSVALFKQHERHIDQRFSSLEDKIETGFSDVKSLIKEVNSTHK